MYFLNQCLEPTDIVTSDLTHVLYAFADSSADTGAIVFPTDSYADEASHESLSRVAE